MRKPPATVGTQARNERARQNVMAFVFDLKMSDPVVSIPDLAVEREPDEHGYYSFRLCRGRRSVIFSVLSYPLEKVRAPDQQGGHNGGPRVYIDMSSWSWDIAVDIVRGDLFDHDKSIERAAKASEAACHRIVDATNGRCPTCSSVLEIHDIGHADPVARYTTVRHEVVCLGCHPRYSIVRRDYLHDNGVRSDWQGRSHWVITFQHVPSEVLGADSYIDPDTGEPDPEACCAGNLYGMNGKGQCIRRSGHDGEHRFRRKEIHSVYIPAGEAIPSPEHPRACACDGCQWYRTP